MPEYTISAATGAVIALADDVQLVFPADAVESDTAVVIEVIENEPGVGGRFEFECTPNLSFRRDGELWLDTIDYNPVPSLLHKKYGPVWGPYALSSWNAAHTKVKWKIGSFSLYYFERR